MAGQPTGPLTTEGSIRSTFKKQVPASLSFPEIRVGTNADRFESKLPSDTGTHQTDSNRLIKFTIPNEAFADFRQAYLAFHMVVATTGGTYRRLHNHVASAFARVRIIGSVRGTLIDTHEYNLLQNLLYEIMTEADVTGSVGYAWGMGSTVERNGWAAGRNYAMPIGNTALAASIWPMKFLKEKLIVEFYLAEPTTCVEADGTVPVITLTNIKLHYDKVYPDLAYENMVRNHIASNGVNLGFKAWEHYHNSVAAARTDNQLTHRSDSVDYFISVMRNQADVNDMTVNDRFITWGKNNTTDFQMLANGKRIPEEPIDATGDGLQAYVNYLKLTRTWGFDGVRKEPPTITVTSFNATRFIVVNDLRAHLETNLANPFGTITDHADAILTINMSAPPAGALRLETFVKYHAVIHLDKNGLLLRVQ